MIRCNHCDVRIDDKAESRTTFVMMYRCPDGQDRQSMIRDGYRDTERGDLCASCQDKAFAGLEALAKEFGLVPMSEVAHEPT